VKLLRPPKRLGLGYAANEAALLHKETRTLALTDALVNVPPRPSAVFDERLLAAIGDNAPDSNSLGNLILKAAGAVNWRGTAAADLERFWSSQQPTQVAAEQLQRGWERDALLGLFFGPSPATLIDPQPAFDSLAGKWIVAPVTDSLIYRSARVGPELSRWVDDVAKWDFTMISPSHFDARPGTPQDLRAAFAPTLQASESLPKPYSAADSALLEDIAKPLIKLKVI